MDCVDDLVKLVGLGERSRTDPDWTTIETSLRLVLPDDYKKLVETFPPGRFQGVVKLIRPGDHDRSAAEYLGYYERRLEDMRRWRKDEPLRFPYPIYPESGGLLPWGVSQRGDLFFWLTNSDDPNSWHLVTTVFDFSHWHEHQPSICRLLHDVVTGRFDASVYEADLSGGPHYRVAKTSGSAEGEQGERNFWQKWKSAPGQPLNEFSVVREALGPGATGVSSVKWPQVESQLRIRLPSDYREFIDTYGAGILGSIVIGSPQGKGEAGLFDLIDWNYRQTATVRLRGAHTAPVYPEPSGMITWGRVGDIACCWAPFETDPESWGVVLSDPSGNLQYQPEWSFSTFLARYVDQGALDPVTLSDESRPEQVTFTPFR